MVLEDSPEVRRGNTYEQVEDRGSKETDGCPLTFTLDFHWLGKCCVLVYLDLYIYFYFGIPLARSKWSILLRIVRLLLQIH
jgi:hypothetical protein